MNGTFPVILELWLRLKAYDKETYILKHIPYILKKVTNSGARHRPLLFWEVAELALLPWTTPFLLVLKKETREPHGFRVRWRNWDLNKVPHYVKYNIYARASFFKLRVSSERSIWKDERGYKKMNALFLSNSLLHELQNYMFIMVLYWEQSKQPGRIIGVLVMCLL